MSAIWSPPVGTALDEPATSARPSRAGERRWMRWLVWLAAIVAVATIAVVLIAKQRATTAVAPESLQTPLALNVHSLGYLEPKSEVIRLAAPSTMEQVRVERLLVREGDAVEAGALLAVLDNFDRRSAAVAEAEARVEVEVARLAQIKAGAKPGDLVAQQAMVSRARAIVQQAEVDAARSERLVERKASPVAELDAARLKLDSAREELRHAEATLESLGEVRTVDVDQQNSQIAAANASLAMARAELATTEVRAPIAGRILNICARPGERVADEGILEIGDTSEMYAVAEVYEADLPRVKVGQPATVRLFTGLGDELHGEVAEIGMIVAKKDVLANDPVADTDARVVEVRVCLQGEDARRVERLSNARVEVTIDTAVKPNATPATAESGVAAATRQE